MPITVGARPGQSQECSSGLPYRQLSLACKWQEPRSSAQVSPVGGTEQKHSSGPPPTPPWVARTRSTAQASPVLAGREVLQSSSDTSWDVLHEQAGREEELRQNPGTLIQDAGVPSGISATECQMPAPCHHHCKWWHHVALYGNTINHLISTLRGFFWRYFIELLSVTLALSVKGLFPASVFKFNFCD